MLKASRDIKNANVHNVVWMPIPDLPPSSQLSVAALASVSESVYSAARSMQLLSGAVNELPLWACLMTLIWCCVVRVSAQGSANTQVWYTLQKRCMALGQPSFRKQLHSKSVFKRFSWNDQNGPLRRTLLICSHPRYLHISWIINNSITLSIIWNKAPLVFWPGVLATDWSESLSRRSPTLPKHAACNTDPEGSCYHQQLPSRLHWFFHVAPVQSALCTSPDSSDSSPQEHEQRCKWKVMLISLSRCLRSSWVHSPE